MKKKLLFCLQTMVFGGVETELITIMKRFDRTKYDLTVLIFYEQDEKMLKKLPDDVKIINLNIDKQYYCSNTGALIKARCKKGHIFAAANIAMKKLFGKPTPLGVSLKKLPTPNEEYDYAICYHMHSPLVLRYVAEKIRAKKKLAWIHNDFSTTRYAIAQYKKSLLCYNKIIAVSKRLREEFLERNPDFSEKTIVVNNIVDDAAILRKSLKTADLDERFQKDEGIKLLTVGRLVEQKGFDLAVKACKILVDKGLPITWYAIGYGVEKENIEKLIQELGLEERFILLGRKDNPFPYMALADLYVQPSRHEGWGLALQEAKIFQKVIVCTNFAGALEQIENEKNGVIVDEITPWAISLAVERLLKDEEFLQKIKIGAGQNGQDDGWQKIEAVFVGE
jgi:glycosyltransferase involved in cell wall biosynthesis